MSIEVIVPGSGWSGPSLRRSESTSNTIELPKLDDGSGAALWDDMSARDGASRGGAGEQMIHLSKSALMDRKDYWRLEGLIAPAEKHSVDAWRKALLCASASGHAKFITNFLKRTPPGLKSLLQTARDSDGFTALHRAVVTGQKEVVKLLIRHGHGPDAQSECFDVLHARTHEGWTSLHIAVVTGDEDMVKLLIDLYELIATPPAFEWDFADNFWMTPLHYAVLGNLQAVMEQLLQWRAYDRHVNAHDYYMRTPMHMASCHAQASIITLVRNRIVDINAVDCCLFTPLHWAVYVGATEAVKCLISRAGEMTIRTTEEDIEGRSVFQIAVENVMIDRKVSRDIEKLLLTCMEIKDEVGRLYRDRQVYVDAANAILVGAALIASVTFGGWLQPPGENASGEQAHRELRVFWAFNSLSFFFSMATVMAGAGAVLPIEDLYIGRVVRNIRRALALTSFLLIMSVVLVLGAFGASGFASLTTVPHLRENMAVTTSIGTAICTTVLIWFLERLYRIRPNWWRFVRPVFEKCHRTMIKRGQGRDLGEIQAELEDAEMRAKEDMQKKDGIRAAGIKLVDLTDLVFALGEASEKASKLPGQANVPALRFESAKKKGKPRALHKKEKVLEHRILAFEKVYEKARMFRTEGGGMQDQNFNMLILSHLSARGVHHWIDRFPLSYCRENSLKKDAERWARIHGGVLNKRAKLEEESTKFDYGMLSFEDWSA